MTDFSCPHCQKIKNEHRYGQLLIYFKKHSALLKILFMKFMNDPNSSWFRYRSILLNPLLFAHSPTRVFWQLSADTFDNHDIWHISYLFSICIFFILFQIKILIRLLFSSSTEDFVNSNMNQSDLVSPTFDIFCLFCCMN